MDVRYWIKRSHLAETKLAQVNNLMVRYKRNLNGKAGRKPYAEKLVEELEEILKS